LLGLQNEDKTTAYSSLLSDEAAVYEVSIEDVNPKDWEQYLQQKGSLIYEFRMGCFGEKNSFSKSPCGYDYEAFKLHKCSAACGCFPIIGKNFYQFLFSVKLTRQTSKTRFDCL